MLQHPGSSWGFGTLLKGSHLCRGIEGGENACYSLLPLTIPAGAEIRTHNLRLQIQHYPLSHDCPFGNLKLTVYGWLLLWFINIMKEFCDMVVYWLG